ncbi:hypothetical protein LIA77_01328 [Sarocladium implicatum]|nr:hypothetical protein LIA77_01328 [Sarocladium implicatum]
MPTNEAAGSSSARTSCSGTDHELVWTELDFELMRLFYADDWELAGLDKESPHALSVLQDLELLITTFEERIGHSDAGFDAWRRLHQAEMNAGKIETANLCVKQSYSPRGPTWDDAKWETRYAWMVHNRQDIANARLSQLKTLGFLHASNVASFWGDGKVQLDRLRGPAIKRRIRKSKPIGSHWNKSIDALLEMQANRSRLDAAKLKMAFWASRYGKKPDRFRHLLVDAVHGAEDKLLTIKTEGEDDSFWMIDLDEDKENTVTVKVEKQDHCLLPFRERNG